MNASDLRRGLDRYGPFAVLGLVAVVVLTVAPSTSPDRRSVFADADFSDLSGAPVEIGEPSGESDTSPPEFPVALPSWPGGRATSAPVMPPSDESAPTEPAPSGSRGDTAEVSPPVAPLHITFAAWSTSTPGSPSDSVPENGLPVGAALGGDTKRTFLRFGGVGSLITLNVMADGRATYLASAGGITACPITVRDWTLRSGAPMAEGPAFDRSRCVDGRAASDGTAWTFDLQAFGDLRSGNGVALVPRAGAPTTPYQITLQRP